MRSTATRPEPTWPDPAIPAPAPPADLDPAWPDPGAPTSAHAADSEAAWPDPRTPQPAYAADTEAACAQPRVPRPADEREPSWSDLGGPARPAESFWSDAGGPRSTPAAGTEAAWPDPPASLPAHAADLAPAWPDPRPALEPAWSDLGAPAHAAEPLDRDVFVEPDEDEDAWDLGAPPLSSVPTAPLSLTRIREERERQQREQPIVYALPPETPPSGLRKFDLGTVPASVTPPRTWRKAAWFAVGTSAAVMVGLAYAAVEFVGKPGEPLIDALPAYPTRPWSLEPLPADQSTNATDRPVSSHGGPQSSSSSRNPDTAIGDSPVATTGAPGSRPTARPGGSTSRPTSTEPTSPSRTTVGPAPVTPTNPEAMGDVTEAYYAKVTEDPVAAHELTTGVMAREGAEAIEARYEGVERVEVQEITIDRNQATTTSTVKLIHEDGTETIEQRQLTFTWGADPKIKDEAATA